MTALVRIEAGQWVLAFKENFGPYPGGGDLRETLERLTHGGSGWDCLHRPKDQFDVHQTERVMPKTYRIVGSGSRHWRDQVVAAAATSGELEALRDKLFAIGFAADRAINDEIARLISPFEAKTRADALAKVHAALPHIFGRQN
ncbi:hypothetical protein [Mesorhizobium retamae]|uniref:Uncharacterized protein n=1 Tax=Mesorhizobium retamae TaxID=2912854 RepID=A0ABS9QM50_9HYPH|nr:hypothetical protein [Mesorhizobium sp. IRAMC:0171]MCG7508523.1 hypothetical protein [Mesorhizobium sp. IRAMC:0171]